MPETFAAIALQHLPRLRAVLSEVLGLEPRVAHLHLDLAEALAADDLDRAEVTAGLARVFGIRLAREQTAACESVADLLRLVAAQRPAPLRACA